MRFLRLLHVSDNTKLPLWHCFHRHQPCERTMKTFLTLTVNLAFAHLRTWWAILSCKVFFYYLMKYSFSIPQQSSLLHVTTLSSAFAKSKEEKSMRSKIPMWEKTKVRAHCSDRYRRARLRSPPSPRQSHSFCNRSCSILYILKTRMSSSYELWSYDIIWSCMIIKLIIIACFNRASSPSSSSSYDDNCFTGAGCCGTGVRRRWKVRNVVVAPLVINVTCEQWTIEHCTCKHITYYTMNVVVIMNMVSFCAWAEYQL